MLATFLIVPSIAPLFGREKITNTQHISHHFFLTILANRNYVTPTLHKSIVKIAEALQHQSPNSKLIYLDANFPFINGFPLLPHSSHSDGKKIDVAFMYSDTNNKLTNKKPSVSGYGVFENPTKKEYNQTRACKNKGFWQYDFTKYLTFGSFNSDLKFTTKENRKLIKLIVNQSKVHKIFIEPHLKKRLKLTSPKIRFHGCKAVRHDDHIHFQIQ